MFIGSWGKVSSILLSVLPDIGKRCRSADMSRGSVMHVNCVVLESSNEARQPGNAVQPGTESRKMTAGKEKDHPSAFSVQSSTRRCAAG